MEKQMECSSIVFIWQAECLLPIYVMAVTQAGILYTTDIIYLKSDPLRNVVGSLYSPTLVFTESHKNYEFFETRTKSLLEFCNKTRLEDKLVLQPMLSQTKRQEDPDGYYRLRSFSITPNGVCKNLGDCLKTRRSRSSCSVDSSPAPLQQRLLGASSQESTDDLPVFRVGLLGASNVGKTTLSFQFSTSEYICAYDTSLDDEFPQRSVCISLNGQEAEFLIYDIPTHEMCVETFCSSFPIDVFVVVYSIIDMQSFETAEEILLYLWKNDYMSSKGVILVGNKADLERRREIPATTGRKLALSWKCKFIETSSGLDHNVNELLVGIFSQVQLNPKRNRNHQKGAIENSKQLFKQILKLGKKAKSCENLFVL